MGKFTQYTDLAGECQVTGCDSVPGFVVPLLSRNHRSQPEPTSCLLIGEVLVTERLGYRFQHRGCRPLAVGETHGNGIQEVVGKSRNLWVRHVSRGLAHCSQPGTALQSPGEDRRDDGVKVGVAGENDVEMLQPVCCGEQERNGVAS